ncbi:MAG: peptide chain release factor N(5)-glutamine methyltransferase [Chloroflexi bacterium]|nr:peptide chain release factor N(5)-glutamine methyltransferase [Chloroflexota bacterium]
MTLPAATGPETEGSPASLPHAGHNGLRSWTAATQRALEAISDEAAVEAELLVRHATGLDRAGIYANPHQELTAEQSLALQELTARRLRREPLPYILGEWDFCGLSFRVSPAVMIPRPETETLVEEALAWRKHRREADPGPATIVDVGAGSGCIAITLAARLPDDPVLALDVSPNALAVARDNAARLSVAGRVRLLQSNLLSAISEPPDLIVANLPYIPDADVPTLQPEVRLHEPTVALGGGPDGLTLIRQLLVQAQSLLSPRGAIILEINPPQSAALPAEAQDLFPGAVVRVVQDLAGLDRVIVIDLLGRPAA